jgi:peptide/nickel transport system substrate-binding protein
VRATSPVRIRPIPVRRTQTASTGSGPYIMSGISTAQVEMKANPDYWGPTKSNFASVILRDVAAPTQLIEIQKATDQIVLSLSGVAAVVEIGLDRRN